jgi:hypothetical protein
VEGDHDFERFVEPFMVVGMTVSISIARRGLALLAAVALSVAVASCSTAPSDAAKAICTSVGQMLGAPPNAAVAMSRSTITDGEHSGDPRLDSAAAELAKGLRLMSQGDIRNADRRIEASCSRLGIWTTCHG